MGVTGGVVGLYHELLGLAEPDILQLALERSVATLMTSDFITVEPYVGIPVGSTDHKEHPFPLPRLRYRDAASVPGYVSLVFNFGKLGSPGERDKYLPVHDGAVLPGKDLAGQGRVEGE